MKTETSNNNELVKKNGLDTQTKAMLIGSVAGGILGAVTAMLIAQRVEKSEGKLELSANEGMRLGMLIFSFLKDISKFG